MYKKTGGRGDSNARLPKVQKCTAVENTFVKSVTFDIAVFLGLDKVNKLKCTPCTGTEALYRPYGP